jgi:hypothetical protein
LLPCLKKKNILKIFKSLHPRSKGRGFHFSIGNLTMLPHSLQEPSYTLTFLYPSNWVSTNHVNEARSPILQYTIISLSGVTP